MDNKRLLQTAGFWLSQGIAVIPIMFLGKKPEVEWLKYTEQLPNGAEINEWFYGNLHNIGVITGWKNLVVIDFDVFAQYLNWKNWCEANGGDALRVMKSTRIVHSARGAHVYLYTEQKAENMKLPGVDILADRKYVLAPPSIHPSGVLYEIEHDALPVHAESLECVLPEEWLIDRIDVKSSESSSACVSGGFGSVDLPDPFDAIENFDFSKRKSDSLISDIRMRFRIEDFFPDRKSTDHGAGRWFIARCPLHNDQNPSMSIDVFNQVCSCRAGCYGSKPLDVINLFAKMNAISNAEALVRLQQML